MEGVVAMEPLVKSFGARVVTVCGEWSAPRHFKLKHLRYAMPGEVSLKMEGGSVPVQVDGRRTAYPLVP